MGFSKMRKETKKIIQSCCWKKRDQIGSNTAPQTTRSKTQVTSIV